LGYDLHEAPVNELPRRKAGGVLTTNCSKGEAANCSEFSPGNLKKLARNCFLFSTQEVEKEKFIKDAIPPHMPPYIATAKYMPHQRYVMRGSHHVIILTIFITCESSFMSGEWIGITDGTT
jgi:hypothetical protein